MRMPVGVLYTSIYVYDRVLCLQIPGQWVSCTPSTVTSSLRMDSDIRYQLDAFSRKDKAVDCSESVRHLLPMGYAAISINIEPVVVRRASADLAGG
jgi:hypothetical protein